MSIIFYFYSSTSSANSDIQSIIICNGTNREETKTDNSICLDKCSLHSPKCMNKCRVCRYSVENCSNLTYQEETKVHHLYSIATDWTLLIDRQAANCRNISDEVFPSIYLGDRYGNISILIVFYTILGFPEHSYGATFL